MAILGVISEIWRFPVKSMQGGRVQQCSVSKQGLLGDRCWAMRDEARKEVQWGKKYPQLMLCKACYRDEPTSSGIQPVNITFPDGITLGSDDDAVHQKLTELVSRKATLCMLQPPDNVEFYKRYFVSEEQMLGDIAEVFAREEGEPMPDMSQFPELLKEFVAVPGTFFDNEELNLLTTASLDHMKALNPEASWDVRRFRPNFLIKTEAGLKGLVENDWVGRNLRIGSAVIAVSAVTPRCGMTVRPQGDLKHDKAILRTIVKEADQNLGVGAHCTEAGKVCVGDPVELV